jgi:hypothetical protein
MQNLSAYFLPIIPGFPGKSCFTAGYIMFHGLLKSGDSPGNPGIDAADSATYIVFKSSMLMYLTILTATMAPIRG